MLKGKRRIKKCATLEAEYHYALRNEDYSKAIEIVNSIILKLEGQALMGYKTYWNTLQILKNQLVKVSTKNA